MKYEFIRTITSDGLELQGLLACPQGGSTETGVIHVHGLAGNFYENRFIDDVAKAVVAKGVDFLTVNTRGHDYISDFICEGGSGGEEYKQIGGIYEIFEDSILDIKAWIELLVSRGANRIILQGHSHGALKVTYYVHKMQDPRIAGLILLSPSDDFGCQRDRIGERFGEALKMSAEMIANGRGADLMPTEYFHYPVSATTYVDIFNERSALKMFNLSGTDTEEFQALNSVRVPTLAIVGSVDEAFMGSPEAYLEDIRGHMINASGFDGYVIEGAPHNYLHFEGEVAGYIGGWLGRRRRDA
jgi:pimeloyl-ACP methyl ester carboxylesterase